MRNVIDYWRTQETGKQPAVASIPVTTPPRVITTPNWARGTAVVMLVLLGAAVVWSALRMPSLRPAQAAPAGMLFAAATDVIPSLAVTATTTPCPPSPLVAPSASDAIVWCCEGVCQEFSTTQEVMAYVSARQWQVTGCSVGGNRPTGAEQIRWYTTH